MFGQNTFVFRGEQKDSSAEVRSKLTDVESWSTKLPLTPKPALNLPYRPHNILYLPQRTPQHAPT